MVRTRRTSPPTHLVKNRPRWEARFRRVLAGSSKGDWATRDCKRTLAAALRELAHGKCVYCESVLDVTSDTEVEHYIAKTSTRRAPSSGPTCCPLATYAIGRSEIRIMAGSYSNLTMKIPSHISGFTPTPASWNLIQYSPRTNSDEHWRPFGSAICNALHSVPSG